MTYENISACYDVGIAKQYGIPAAVLLNKLNYLSTYTSREDGYCWRTAKELEDELGLTRTQQDLAIKKLVQAEIIEVKNTYIQGTQIKCKHFKILKNCKSDFNETCKSEVNETYKSINNNIYNINNIDNNKINNKKSAFKKPTIEEIENYCKERNNGINANTFYDFYESKDWYVGKNKMKDWKACVRTWEQRSNKKEIKEVNVSEDDLINTKIMEDWFSDYLESEL